MAEALFAFAVNATWQAALIGALGLLLARRLQPARLRFQFLAVTLAVSAVAPLFTLLPRDARPLAPVVAAPSIPPIGARIAAGIYLAAAAMAALRLVRAAAKARRIAASSAINEAGLRVSPLITAPVTIGRTIFVPPAIAADAHLLGAALAHERAHVRRNDYALHVALELLALPLAFHPVVILLRRAVAEAREMACDEEAAAEFGASAYAQALVRIATLAAPRAAAMTVSMASTSIERRVIALLRREERRVPRAMPVMLALPFLAAAACSRVDVAPAVEQLTLCGRWALVPEASDVHEVLPRKYDAFTQTIEVLPRKYDAFTQTIEHGPTKVAVKQHRVLGGRAIDVAWSVITDGVPRAVPGARSTRGAATWKDGRLTITLTGPGPQRESAVAFIRGGRLVVDGVTNRGRYHTEFKRIDP